MSDHSDASAAPLGAVGAHIRMMTSSSTRIGPGIPSVGDGMAVACGRWAARWREAHGRCTAFEGAPAASVGKVCAATGVEHNVAA
jgi:hypothetical protein